MANQKQKSSDKKKKIFDDGLIDFKLHNMTNINHTLVLSYVSTCQVSL